MAGARIGRLAPLALVAAFAATAHAADDLSLYLAETGASTLVLDPLAPTASQAQEIAINVSMGETVAFGPFDADPETGARRLGRGPVSFAVYLATGAAGMPGCAEVTMVLAKVPAAGAPVVLVTTGVTTSLVPKASLVDPIAASASMLDDPAARALVPGDRLAVTVLVANHCSDGAHSVRLLYASTTRASRLGFTDDCPAVDDPDQTDTDDDGIGDACDDCPEAADADQADTDGDGIGSACDACPDAAGEPGEAKGCPCLLADCDDTDACTTDACVAVEGCVHATFAGFDFVECRLLMLRDILLGDPAVARALKMPSSPARRALRLAGKAVLRAERAKRHGARAYPRRVQDVQRRLQLFVQRVFDAERVGGLPLALRDRLLILAGEAIDAVGAI